MGRDPRNRTYRRWCVDDRKYANKICSQCGKYTNTRYLPQWLASSRYVGLPYVESSYDSQSQFYSTNAAQYNRIENDKIDVSISILDQIAKDLGVSLSELFASMGELKNIYSTDKTLMEKVTLMESLDEEEKNTIYTMLDTFIGKKKLKDTLSSMLKEV